MGKQKNTAWLEFAGKLITPLTIIILVLSFKSTVEERLGQATEVSVLGSDFKFDSKDFHEELSALELYYFVHAHRKGESYFEKASAHDDELAAMYLLSSKGLLTIEEVNGLGDVEGIFLGLHPTEKGDKLIKSLGLR
jgi:hypothetical protein